MSMMAQAMVEPPTFGNALTQIATLFQTEWKRLRQLPTHNPSTALRPDLLTVVLPDALSEGEWAQSATADGRSEVKQQLDGWIDTAYPRLANQIEALLMCYVTWTDIEIGPDNRTVNVRIGLRDLPQRREV